MTYRAGIDIGSVTTKCVIAKESQIVSSAIARSGTDTEQTAEFVFAEALKTAGLSASDIKEIVSTGYGRRLFKKADRVVTEISAAAKGAWLLDGKKDCLVLDVGGQDTKVIEIDAAGEVSDFLMNDKCAAGTGRFLELMSHVFGTDLEGISKLAEGSSGAVKINSTCSVFAESEVVSLIASAAAKEDIAAGIFDAIASRIFSMIRQFDKRDCVLFCGGGAKSAALRKAVAKASGKEIVVLPDPQFVVAFGATQKY